MVVVGMAADLPKYLHVDMITRIKMSVYQT